MIGEALELGDVGEPYLRRRVYQYRIQLGRLLGHERRDRMLSEGREQRYYVRDRGWSFIWIRHSPSEKRSALLY
jgi:hypothetical protein